METYIQVNNISKSFGDLVLFRNISFQVSGGQKIALVAKNGSGKSTLFNILCGRDTPDTGSVTFHKDIMIGFLEQDPAFNENNTVLEQVFLSSGEIMQVIGEFEKSLVSGDNKRIQKATEKMDAIEGWNYEAEIKQILSKLRIVEFDQKMGTLSGGQRKRIALANTLIREPDLLVLDEPTNQLDVEMIEWLEDYLKKSNITLLMVTHDRYFLDRVCSEVIELDDHQLYWYQGNYTAFLEKREERLANDKVNTEKARNLLRKELEWIRRQPKARTTKSKSRIDAFIDLKDQAAGKRAEKQMTLNIQGKRLGTKIIEAKNLYKSFDKVKILTNFNYIFSRNEKTGIIGNNGTGKTTLLNLLTGTVVADSGSIEVGKTVTFAYYRQEGMSFDNKMKVIDVARSIAEVVNLGNGVTLTVSQFLNYFLFSAETQQTFVYKLSGGEKRRLYLATILMRNPNFLILDEPTNDLDILTLNVLEEYLMNFRGCVIIVSHDRYFMDKLVDHLFVFEGQGKIRDFPGNYSDYRDLQAGLVKRQKPAEKNLRKIRQEIISNVSSENRKLSYKEKMEYKQLCKEIEDLEKEYKDLEFKLNTDTLHHQEAVEISNKIGSLINQIEEKSNRWLELSELMDDRDK